MEIDRKKTVCFTGHRPEKLPGGGLSDSSVVRRIKSVLYSQIADAVSAGYDTFITGMQRGVDLWAGEAVLYHASSCSEKLHLVAALPYRSMGDSFKGEDKWIFGRIMRAAEKTVVLSEKYTPVCMKDRNRFMVDNSSRLIAVMENERSGTGQTLRYAEKQGLEIHIIRPAEFLDNDDTDQYTLL